MSARRWVVYVAYSGENRLGSVAPSGYYAGYAQRDKAIDAARRLLARNHGVGRRQVVQAEVMSPGRWGARRSIYRGERRGWFGPDGSIWARSAGNIECEQVGCPDCHGTGGTGWVGDVHSGMPWAPCPACWPRDGQQVFLSLSRVEVDARYPGFFTERSPR